MGSGVGGGTPSLTEAARLATHPPNDVVGLELFGRELYPELILALAALLTAIAGVLSAWAALRRTKTNTKKTAEEECLERIKAAYQETEQMAQALHNLRTKGILE